MISDALFSSERMDWETPSALFDKLNEEFVFTLDPCASKHNHKCEKYYTITDNGLSKDWGNERVFCNPPYGRSIYYWVKKCAAHTGLCVMLIPARTDTKWFHEFIYQKPNVEIRFIMGRIRFVGAKHPAPFPSMIVVFNPGKK